MRRISTRAAATRQSAVAAAIGAVAIVAAAIGGPAAAQQPAGAPKPAVNTSMCIGCHGIPGYKNVFPSVYSVPLIAGQPAKYIEAALHGYRRGERSHPTMQAIARGVTEEEIVTLAQYYGTANGAAPGAATTVSADRRTVPGQAIHDRQCAQCHGKDGNTPLDASYPRLAGQHRDYLLRTLLDYQSGARKNAIMGAQVQALSRRDLRDLAEFYAGLPGQLHLKR